MGDFGYKPRNLHLLDGQLTLDPQIVSMMGDLEAKMAARRILGDFLQPNWALVMPDFQSIVSAPSSNIIKTPSLTPNVPAYTPGAGPDTPRAGELSDVTKALY
ncbi:MAG: hypothetical protein ACRD43_02610, partial [Pyrinomonadaceae bacterium]